MTRGRDRNRRDSHVGEQPADYASGESIPIPTPTPINHERRTISLRHDLGNPTLFPEAPEWTEAPVAMQATAHARFVVCRHYQNVSIDSKIIRQRGIYEI
jgi:hypothetical protein